MADETVNISISDSGTNGDGDLEGLKVEDQKEETEDYEEYDLPTSLEEYYAGIPEEDQGWVKNLFDSETKGLQSALNAERQSRKDFEKQLKELKPLAEKGSELEKKLEEMSLASETQAKHLEQELEFYRAASREGVTDLDLAWLAVTKYEVYDSKGKPDFNKLRDNYPALFQKGTVRVPLPQANAGSGAGTEVPRVGSMNEWIRSSAGS